MKDFKKFIFYYWFIVKLSHVGKWLPIQFFYVKCLQLQHSPIRLRLFKIHFYDMFQPSSGSSSGTYCCCSNCSRPIWTWLWRAMKRRRRSSSRSARTASPSTSRRTKTRRSCRCSSRGTLLFLNGDRGLKYTLLFLKSFKNIPKKSFGIK